MVLLYLNDRQVIFDTGQSLKLIKNNALFEGQGSYTLEIAIPLNVASNRSFFGNVQRMDVTKRYRSVKAKVMADNRPVIVGTAVITNVTPESVKIQIIAGNSDVKYITSVEKVYIDEIYMQPPIGEHQFEPWALAGDDLVRTYVNYVSGNPDDEGAGHNFNVLYMSEPNVIGIKGLFNFLPIKDATNGITRNSVRHYYRPGAKVIYTRPDAVQPNLLYVFTCIVRHFGYTIRRNDIDPDFLSRIYIASPRLSLNISDALPHWTVTEFIGQFQQLFNVTVNFNDVDMTVSITRMDVSETVVYIDNVIDDFSTDVNSTEDADDSIAISNIRYKGSTLHDIDIVDDEILAKFNRVNYTSYSALTSAVAAMDESTRKTLVASTPSGMYVWDSSSNALQRINHLGAYIRDKDNDKYVELKMCPVALVDDFVVTGYIDAEHVNMVAMTANNPYVAPENTSAWEAVQSGNVDEGTAKDDIMELYLIDDIWLTLGDTGAVMVKPLTDPDYKQVDERGPYSLSLNRWGRYKTIADYHVDSLVIDKNSETVIKFTHKGLLDVTAEFRIRNKRYRCKKLEYTISEDRLNSVITGWFCEIL